MSSNNVFDLEDKYVFFYTNNVLYFTLSSENTYFILAVPWLMFPGLSMIGIGGLPLFVTNNQVYLDIRLVRKNLLILHLYNLFYLMQHGIKYSLVLFCFVLKYKKKT